MIFVKKNELFLRRLLDQYTAQETDTKDILPCTSVDRIRRDASHIHSEYRENSRSLNLKYIQERSLKNLQSDDTEDTELDLMGYLVLLRIARRRAVQSSP